MGGTKKAQKGRGLGGAILRRVVREGRLQDNF